MSGDTSPYTNLITSEHASLPKFLPMIAVCTQGYADEQVVLNSFVSLFDIDLAVGSQLDEIGLWIGLTRYLTVPVQNVYFSLDSSTLGLDQGYLQGPYDPTTGLVSLDDKTYRTLLYAKIADNHWDGTVPGAYVVLNPVFPGNTVFIQDNEDMTMYLGVVGPNSLDAVTYALFTGGYLNVKPLGVRITGYVTSSSAGSPVFGLDSDGSAIGGLDHGAFAVITGGS